MAPFSKASKEKRKERRNHAGKRTKKASTRRSREISENASKIIQNRSFLDQNPSSEASWAPPAAEKRTTRAPRGPRGAKTTQSEHQDRPKSVSRAIFSKIRPQGCGSQPSRTLCLLWQTEKVTGPPALKRRLLSHFAGAKGVSDRSLPLPPPFGIPP